MLVMKHFLPDQQSFEFPEKKIATQLFTVNTNALQTNYKPMG